MSEVQDSETPLEESLETLSLSDSSLPEDNTASTDSDLHKLLLSEKYSDLTFACNGEEFRVHKAVVCIQSPILAAACDGPFKVRQLLETFCSDLIDLLQVNRNHRQMSSI